VTSRVHLWRPTAAGLRNATLHLTGLALIVHEALWYRGPERWGLLTLLAGMVGLPSVLARDERDHQPEPAEPK